MSIFDTLRKLRTKIMTVINEIAPRNGSTDVVVADERRMAARPGSNIQPVTFQEALQCAEIFADSGMFGVRSVSMALTVLMTGLELGLTAAQSLRSIYVIEGRPCLSAHLIVGLAVSKPDVCEYFRVVESDDSIATYVTKRRGSPEVLYSYTHQMALNAGLLNKDNWKKSKPDMLRSRCVAGLGRMVYPDILMGLYIPDEISSGEDLLESGGRQGGNVALEESTTRSESITKKLAAKREEAASSRSVNLVPPTLHATASAVPVDPSKVDSPVEVAAPVAINEAEAARSAKATGVIKGLAKLNATFRAKVDAWISSQGWTGTIDSFSIDKLDALKEFVRTERDAVAVEAKVESERLAAEKAEERKAAVAAAVVTSSATGFTLEEEDAFADDVPDPFGGQKVGA
jgi:hypothetical protein